MILAKTWLTVWPAWKSTCCVTPRSLMGPQSSSYKDSCSLGLPRHTAKPPHNVNWTSCTQSDLSLIGFTSLSGWEIIKNISHIALQRPSIISPSCHYTACLPQSGVQPRVALQGVWCLPHKAVNTCDWETTLKSHLSRIRCHVFGCLYYTGQESLHYQWAQNSHECQRIGLRVENEWRNRRNLLLFLM